MEGKGQRILMTCSRRPSTMGHWQRAYAAEQGARFSFASATVDAKAGWISKSLAGTLCTAVAEEVCGQVLHGNSGRLEPRMEPATE